MDQNILIKIIKRCRRKLNLAEFLKKLLSALCIGAGAAILFQAAAFLIPLYYVNLYCGFALLLAVLSALAVAIIKRVSMQQAALTIDRFGFEERIVTAYEHLSKDSPLIALQRADAVNQLSLHQDRIRIPILPSWKKIIPVPILIAALFTLALIPSETKKQAQELHNLKEEVSEKEEEIEELVEVLTQLEQESLTPEQQAELQEMIEGLQSSLADYQQVTTAQMLAAASEKLDYRYENMSSQIDSLAQSLQNGAAVSPVTAQSLQAMAEKLQNMSGSELAKGNGSQNGQGQGNGNGQDDGQGNGSGQGNGQGNGNGQGQGNGQGNGQGQGQGNGQGNGQGRGTGSSNTQHDYVSVPNAIADSGNLTGNAVNHESSEYFRAQNGLSWEGEHVSHESVIGSYEQNAYEGISQGRYPSGMEDIIKDYFSSFNERR